MTALRRSLPGDASAVRVENRDGLPLELSVFRVHAPRAFVRSFGTERSPSLANTAAGAESERLLRRADALPRRGPSLDLVSQAHVARTCPRRDDQWPTTEVPLGALPAGLYLVRATYAGWAASAPLSVGALTLLVRRGDVADRVVVTDGEGAPQPGVAVERLAGRPPPRQRDRRRARRGDVPGGRRSCASLRGVAGRRRGLGRRHPRAHRPLRRARLPRHRQDRLASLVATHVHGGALRSASATVDVEPARRFGLRVAPDRRSYPEGAHAQVTVTARNDDGSPRDAVVSLWVADAGWWEIADDDRPPPDAWFRTPGSVASAGDSAQPRGYGTAEGRRFESVFEWNGRALPGATFRHAWGYDGPLLRFDARGTLLALASRVAVAGGLRSAATCWRSDRWGTGRSSTRARLRVRNVPWYLAAERIADVTNTLVSVDDDTLVFCNASGSGRGYGSGAGRGLRGRGVSGPTVRSAPGPTPTSRPEGTVFFVGAQRLGPTGEATIDVALPPRPGRWRFEALALDGGAGAAGHAFATSAPPAVAVP